MLPSRKNKDLDIMNLSKSLESFESDEKKGDSLDENRNNKSGTRKELSLMRENEEEIVNLSLVEKDKTLFNLKCLLDDKNNYLLDKKKELSKKRKENEYLQEVSDEYKKEYMSIVKDKENQLNALYELSNHFKNLAKEYNKNKDILKKVRKDQREILNEIKKIKFELKNIKEYGSDEEERVLSEEIESPYEEEMENFIENESDIE